MTLEVSADHLLKVAIDQRGPWEYCGARQFGQLGGNQEARPYVDPIYPRVSSKIEMAVISGRANVGVGVGIVEGVARQCEQRRPRTNHRAQSPPRGLPMTGTSRRSSAHQDDRGTSAALPLFILRPMHPANMTCVRPDGNAILLSPGRCASRAQTRRSIRPCPARLMSAGQRRQSAAIAQKKGRIRIVAKVMDIPNIRYKTVSVTIAMTEMLQKR